MQTIVIGAGVTGLSAALRLQEQGHKITIVARDFPSPFETTDAQISIDYASMWAGAHNRFILPRPGIADEERDHAMSLATFACMEDLAKRYPEAAITFMKGIEYFEAPSEEYRALTEQSARDFGFQDFRFLGRDELPDDKVKLGIEYRTWCVNPMVYCAFLLRRFVHAGGKTLVRTLRDEREALSIPGLGAAKLIVNCSGYGFGDKASFITRGQTCLVANECDATVTRQNADGSWSFSVPRNFHGGTIIGGTKEPDNWGSEPSSAVRETLLDTFAATYPSIRASEGGQLRVLRDIVGRRPTRKGGMRLEREDIGDGRAIIHAYGLGGRGFELSWGVAEGVIKLVNDPIKSKL
ncbi:FAD dependent oxidoreductase-like protein [Plectosphaerella plurivora]|uniref:FAD dependent oxidoreductase-like protein n=1 Tax=Plectosphaerella plurivora TaxID=936078 RepID=A0A9P8VGQ8_9PEZI|nr:FAD dependent oxidoreductase-like protein [Plectosphaerella plurivora]